MQTHYVNLKRIAKWKMKTNTGELESRLHFVMDFYECPYNLLVFAAYDPYFIRLYS